MLSALLSIYRAEDPRFFEMALKSIWHEQTLKPAQVVLVKDGSLTVELNAVIARWRELLGNAFCVVSLRENVGLGAALNQGLAHCRYELVGRMDTDDVSLPNRFAAQVDFMEKNPHIVACSAQLEEWDSGLTRKLDERRLPCDPQVLASFAKHRSPLSHPLAMFRKSVVHKLGGYPPLRKGQDYALWALLLSRGYELANLPDVLLRMRTGHDLFARRGWRYFKGELEVLRYQRSIGFLSTSEFATNVALKGTLRLSPRSVKALVYRFLR